MYKTIALLLVALFVAASLPALAEGSVPEALYSQEITEVSASPDGAQDNAAPEGAASSGSLPLGTWVNGEDGVSFSFETETLLTEEQRALVASGAFAQEVPTPCRGHAAAHGCGHRAVAGAFVLFRPCRAPAGADHVRADRRMVL